MSEIHGDFRRKDYNLIQLFYHFRAVTMVTVFFGFGNGMFRAVKKETLRK